MLVLALETSTARSSVALADGDRVLAAASLGVPRRHGEFLAPAVRFLLDAARVPADRLGGVAVGVGPGLYTGLRVGIATAQTFASARGLPAVGVSGLDALAHAERGAGQLTCAVVDARRGELFWGLYRPDGDGVSRVGDLRVGPADTLAAELDELGEPTRVVGEVPAAVRSTLSRVADVVVDAEPDAADVARLAAARFAAGESVRPESLRPLYLRHPDAAIGWQARGRLATDPVPAAAGDEAAG